MTKEVFISLDDMNSLWHSTVEICGREESPFKFLRPDMTKEDFRLGARIFEHVLNEWFDAQPEAAQWISVEEKMPDAINTPIFARLKNEFNDIAIATIIYNALPDWTFIYDMFKPTAGWIITHWMPIPPLPGVKDDN